MDFRGQVAIVDGGASAIGRAVVRMLVARGAQVVAGCDERAGAEGLRALCAGLPGAVLTHEMVGRDRAAADALIAATLDQCERVDALITCVAGAGYAPFGELTLAQWRATLAANLDGVYYMCKAALRPMMKRRYGRIVNIGALHGVGGSPGQADFSAATGGVLGFTRALAREAAAWNITVNAVTPGLIEAEVLDTMPPETRAWGERVIALRRIGTPDEAAAAAVFLASPLASYITGQTLAVDGGWRMT